jgi:hypothetical protein
MDNQITAKQANDILLRQVFDEITKAANEGKTECLIGIRTNAYMQKRLEKIGYEIDQDECDEDVMDIIRW